MRCQAIAEVPAAGAVPSEVVGGGLARWTHGGSEPLQLAVEELNAAEVCGVSRLVVGRFSTVPAARVGCSFAIASHRAARFSCCMHDWLGRRTCLGSMLTRGKLQRWPTPTPLGAPI